MNKSSSDNYYRIAKAIDYIRSNFKEQPDLELVASDLALSPFHFQRLFSEWAGVSPKKFLQFTTLEYSKSLLKEQQLSLFDVAHESGLSGTSRLHDLFVNIEGMSPGEFKSGGEGLQINYSFMETHFGRALIASTSKGICKLAFIEEEKKALEELNNTFPEASMNQQSDVFQENALSVFKGDFSKTNKIKLHLKGTDFQLKVWNALLTIPSGNLNSYGNIAEQIGNKNASRAVGTAIGDNPVAFIIPCHRVIQANGNYGEYRWGSTRKKILIGWEAAQLNHEI